MFFCSPADNPKSLENANLKVVSVNWKSNQRFFIFLYFLTFKDHSGTLINNENSHLFFFLLALSCSHTHTLRHLHKGCIDTTFSTVGILANIRTLRRPCGSILIFSVSHFVLAFVELLVKVTPGFTHQPDCPIHCCLIPAHRTHTHVRTSC